MDRKKLGLLFFVIAVGAFAAVVPLIMKAQSHRESSSFFMARGNFPAGMLATRSAGNAERLSTAVGALGLLALVAGFVVRRRGTGTAVAA